MDGGAGALQGSRAGGGARGQDAASKQRRDESAPDRSELVSEACSAGAVPGREKGAGAPRIHERLTLSSLSKMTPRRKDVLPEAAEP